MGHVNIVDYPRPRCCFSNLSLVSVGMGGGGGGHSPQTPSMFSKFFGRVRGYNEHGRSREVVLRMQCGLTECSMNVQQAWPGRERSEIGVNT